MPRDALAIKAQLGVVSQFDSLDPDFTCAENLLVYGRYFGLGQALLRQRIRNCWSSLRSRTKRRPSPGNCRAA